MKKALITIAVSILALVIAKITPLGLVIEGPLEVGTLVLIIKYRYAIAGWFRSLRLPVFVAAIVSTWPFMLFEENINCLPTGCKLIPSTIPFLTAFVIVMLVFLRIFKVKSFRTAIVVFSLVGLYIETMHGVAVAQIRALPLGWLLFFIPWIAMSYAYIAVVPATVLIESNKRKLREVH